MRETRHGVGGGREACLLNWGGHRLFGDGEVKWVGEDRCKE